MCQVYINCEFLSRALNLSVSAAFLSGLQTERKRLAMVTLVILKFFACHVRDDYGWYGILKLLVRVS